MIRKDYQEHKEEYNKIFDECAKERREELKGLTGNRLYSKIHEMREKGRW